MEIEKSHNRYILEDVYGTKLRLSPSSSASKDCIWLGIQDIKFSVFKNGWVLQDDNLKKRLDSIYEIVPSANQHIVVMDAVHINRDDAQQIIDMLQVFVDSGSLPSELPETPKRSYTLANELYIELEQLSIDCVKAFFIDYISSLFDDDLFEGLEALNTELEDYEEIQEEEDYTKFKNSSFWDKFEDILNPYEYLDIVEAWDTYESMHSNSI